MKRDIELLFELGAFRYIPRSWRQFLNKDFANNAEHSFRMAWTAMMIATAEGADVSKVIKMALMHDLGESRTGDVHYLSRLYTKRDEELAMADIFAGTSLEKEFKKLWEEYQERKSLEARIAKDADTLDVDMELREQKFRGYVGYSPLQDKHRLVTSGRQLYTKTAKNIWKAIQKADPRDWHTNSRNRFTAGDWKPKEKRAITK